jgi:two-component system phosphate regulon sensor histidine kinase PhoR
MKRTIFWKLFGSYVLIILSLSALFLVFSFLRIRAHEEDTLAGELENLGRVLNIGIVPRLENGPSPALEAFVKETGKEIHARVTVVDLEGKVLADSEIDPTGMENHRYRPEVTEALEGKIGRSRRFSYTVEQNMLYIGMPIESSGRTLGVLRLSYFMDAIDVLLARLRLTIARIVLIGAFAALGLALLVSMRIARPIGRLTTGARAMAKGRFDTRVVLGHRDEFRELGDAFNAMSGRIQELFAQITSRTNDLDCIVSSLREGLVVVDREGRIVLVNDAFKRIIGAARPEGRFVWEVVRKPLVQDFVDRARAAAEPVTDEIVIGDRTYSCTWATMKEPGRVLLTLIEISPKEMPGKSAS